MRHLFSLKLLRDQLASTQALTQLSILGFISGIVTGLIIVIFRFTFEKPHTLLLPGNNPEDFERLSNFQHFFLPLGGALVIGAILHYVSPENRRTGIAHIIERLENYQGNLPFKNFMLQFSTGALSILSGLSAGREGAAAHLGATISSQLGQWLELPNNAVRILVACGAAAAISASFNTPIAGVIFAMEVILKEYTISSVTPIILASVAGAIVTHFFYGATPAFDVPIFTIGSLEEIPFLLLTGFIMGALASLFIWLIRLTSDRSQALPVFFKLTLVGLCTGTCALIVPQVMGIGYDTVEAAFQGSLSFQILCLIMAAKLLLTSLSVGLGSPSGVIGPTVVIGAVAGGAMGYIGSYLAPDSDINQELYAMLGMAAMMGATLQAPLAALTTLMELTANTHIIMPGMLVIVVSNLVVSELFKLESVFTTLLISQNIDLKTHPLNQVLDRTSVFSVMSINIPLSPSVITVKQAHELLAQRKKWIIIMAGEQPAVLLSTTDLARHIEQTREDGQITFISLLNIPAQRFDLAPVNLRSTLRHALEQMDLHNVDALYAHPSSLEGVLNIKGVVTRQAIEKIYRYNKSQSPSHHN